MSKEFESECVEPIKALRICADQPCCDNCPRYDNGLDPYECVDKIHRDAAAALEVMQSDLAKKDSQISEWKNAWRIANSLYKSAQSEIDELRAYERELVERIETLKTMQNGEEKHE